MQSPTTITNPTGTAIHFGYDQYNNIIHTTDEEGNTTTYRHDPMGNVISAITPQGAKVTITYDSLNRQKHIVEPDGTETKLTYDPLGNITSTTDALGNTTIREYDQASQLTAITDPQGNKTTLTYTPLRQLETITNPNGATQTYTYYPGGKLKAITQPCGETETYEYNKTGQVSKVTNALGHTTTLKYDSLDRVVETINPQGHSKHYTYDAIGNITSTTDENGNKTQYKYSPLGDITEVIDPTGHSTKYNYDAARRLTKLEQSRLIEDPLTGATTKEYQLTTYQRNKKGEVIAVTSPLGDVVNYKYDKTGKVTSKQDEDGLETLYEYNLAGNLTKISYADGKTVALSYNALKQLTEMQDWLGTTKIETDAQGRTTKTTDYEGNQVGYEYNELGQREKIVYPDGREVTYEYNPSGRLETVTAGKSNAMGVPTAKGNQGGSEITRYKYDPMGRIAERILPDSTKTEYNFTPLGALSSLTHSKGGEILDQFRYTYDPVGNITQIEKHRAGIEADNGVFQYTYDPLNRLIQATTVGHGAATTNPSIKTYAYDNLGNRISSTKSNIQDSTQPQYTHHTFNARNQLIRTQEGETINDYQYDKRGNLIQVTADGQLQTSYTYDATNMMTAASSQSKGTAEYTYNGFRSRVAKLETFKPQGQASPAYQASTHPPSANLPDPCKEVRYILDMTRQYDNLLMTKGHGGQEQNQSFIWGNSLLSASVYTADEHGIHDTAPQSPQPQAESAISSISTIHYLQDHLGSPIRLLSNDGNSINALAYDEFGVQEVFPMQAMQTQHSLKGQQPQQQLTKLFSNPFGYTGYQLDDITEMHYAQARYYTPTTGRFTAEDPIQDRLNWYGYCSANPMTSVDPTGLSGGGLNDMLNTIDDGTNVAPWHNPAPRQTTPRTPTPTPSPRPSEPEPARQGGGECGARNLAPVDFIHCCVNGLVFVCFQTGDVLSTLQPIAPVTGIVFCDTLTSAQRLELERTLVYLNQSETFRNLWDTLQYGGELLTIAFTDGFMTRYMPYSRRIYWDPAHGLVLGNGIYVQSPALGLAHEMGHAAQHLEEHYYFTTWYANHTSDALRLRAENNNIARFETPIANELGEYARRSYRDFIGDFGMSTSTDWGILHTRPAWHYLSPLVWGQQRVTFESQNTWMPEPECDVK